MGLPSHAQDGLGGRVGVTAAPYGGDVEPVSTSERNERWASTMHGHRSGGAVRLAHPDDAGLGDVVVFDREAREEAEDAADDLDGWVAWISGEYVVRTGCYDSRSEAEDAAEDMDGGYAEKVSDTAVTVTVTGSGAVPTPTPGPGGQAGDKYLYLPQIRH